MSDVVTAPPAAGISARTHRALCIAQFRTEAAGRWIPVGLFMFCYMVLIEDMGGPRLTVAEVLFGLLGAAAIPVFRMPVTQLRALGLGRNAQWTHLVISTVAGTALYLVCVVAMWGVAVLRGVQDGPRWWLPAVIAVTLAVVGVLVDGRRIRRGGVDGPGRSAGDDAWDRLARHPDGHRRVMESMARSGMTSTVVGFFLVMVPGQLVLRAMSDNGAVAVGLVLTVVLAGTTVFVRVVQAERAAGIWMVYGGAPRYWQRAVLRRAWVVPVSFLAVYLLAWGLEHGLGAVGGDRGMQMMRPTDGAEWFASVAVVISYAMMTTAVTTSMLSITVTKKYAGQEVVAGIVLVVNLALAGWLTYGVGVGLRSWALVWCPLAVVAWTTVAVAMFLRSRGAVEVGPRSGVERYFGVRLG